MSDLIPEINFTDFVKIVKDGRIGELKSCEVKFNCDYIFTAMIPHGDVFASDYIKTQAEYLGVKANISGGQSPEELIKEKEVAEV